VTPRGAVAGTVPSARRFAKCGNSKVATPSCLRICVFDPLALSQAHSRASAIFLDKFNSGRFNCGSDLIPGTCSPS
jgi:hypothetical protein